MRVYLVSSLLLSLLPWTLARVEQVHMMYGSSPSEMVVSWATPLPARGSDCYIGISPYSLSWHTAGTTEVFTQTVNKTSPSSPCPSCISESLHYCTFKGLKPDTRYYYKVGSVVDGVFSAVMSFKSQIHPSNPSPLVLGVYGDLGLTNDVSLQVLRRKVHERAFEAVIHVGDFAYDMDDEGGLVGQEFMRSIESIASKVPYITCIGNHEYGPTRETGALQHYIKRFGQLMPGGTDGMYFSINIGKAHLVSFTTEPYFWQTDILEAQWEWLEEDLKSVDRLVTPWVIAIGHRPPYCSNNSTDDCALTDSVVRKAFEELFNANGVDIAFWGHEHTYERLFPTFDNQVYGSTSSSSDPYVNPGATVHIITGSAGCKESPGSPFVSNPKEWSAARSMAYGYGQLEVVDGNKLTWKQFDDADGSVIDQFEITKSSPFNHLKWRVGRGQRGSIRGVWSR